MNRTKRVPFAWLTLSGVCFAAGWMLRPNIPRGAAESVPVERARAGTVSDVSLETEEVGTKEGLGSSARETKLTRSRIASLGDELRRATNPLARREAFLALIAGLTRENALPIREQIAHLDPNDPLFQDFHFAWGKIAGLDAVMAGIDTEAPDMGPALAGWASANPAAVSAWFHGLDLANDPAFDAILKDRGVPAAELRSYLARGLLDGLAGIDPGAALAFAGELGASGDPAALGLVDRVARQMLASQGSEAAARWAEALGDGYGTVPYRRPDGNLEQESVRAAAMRVISNELVRGNPQAAASWAATTADPNAEPWVVREVAVNWARQSPPDAVAWLETLGDSRGQREGLSAAYAHWAGRDAVAASEYLAAQPSSVARDFAINGFTAALARSDPGAAVLWAQDIAMPGLREAAVVRAGQRYFQTNPAAASSWLSSSNLSAEAQQRVTSGL